jgi:succinate dehydrogenase/fumarate reductase-like Fe-S protein
MGHYDSCREGYCPRCGQAPGAVPAGSTWCKACLKESKQQAKKPTTYDAVSFQDWLNHPVTKDLFLVWETQEFHEVYGWGRINDLNYKDFKRLLKAVR